MKSYPTDISVMAAEISPTFGSMATSLWSGSKPAVGSRPQQNTCPVVASAQVHRLPLRRTAPVSGARSVPTIGTGSET